MDQTAELQRRVAWLCGQVIALEAAFAFLQRSTRGSRHLLELSDEEAQCLDWYCKARLEKIDSPDPALTKKVVRQVSDRLRPDRRRTSSLSQAMFPFLDMLASDYGSEERAALQSAKLRAAATAAAARLARRRTKRT